MKRLFACFALGVFALAAAPDAWANAPAPEHRRPKNAVRREGLPSSPMSIEAREGAREVTLQIPRGMLRQLLAEADAGGASTTAGLQTALAGLFLSLSLITAGVWVARTRRRRAGVQLASLTLVCLSACGVLATVALARNIAPPLRPRPLDAGTLLKAAPAGETLSGTVRVEVVSDGGEIKLIVPKRAAGEE